MAFEQVFLVAWFTALIYVGLIYLLAFRLGWLRRSGHAPEAPTTVGFLFEWLGFGAVGFIFSARHRQLGDSLASALVVICRILFLIYLPLFGFILSTFLG